MYPFWLNIIVTLKTLWHENRVYCPAAAAMQYAVRTIASVNHAAVICRLLWRRHSPGLPSLQPCHGNVLSERLGEPELSGFRQVISTQMASARQKGAKKVSTEHGAYRPTQAHHQVICLGCMSFI